MSLRSILDALRSIPPLPRTGRRTAFRPRLETLDDRCLPSFSPITSLPIGPDPQAVVTPDFNNDGRLDLATAGDNGVGRVSVRLATALGGNPKKA